jgi:uncharacterized membrane protein YkoI
MKNMIFPRLMLMSIAALVAFASPVTADDDAADHNLARRLVAEGQIRALAVIVDEVKAKVPGEMLEVEFESEKGVYKYELKILRPNGKVQEVEVDARTGAILKIEDDD